MTISVRPLAATDKARWHALFDAYIAFYEATVSDDVIETTWQRLLAGGEGNPIGVVACDEHGELVGIAHVLFHRSTWSPTWYCYLEDLFVAPAARRQGAGRALIEATYREADRRGATRTYWVTQESNDCARTLYEQAAHKAPFVQYRR